MFRSIPALLALILLSCAPAVRRFPLREPMWRDDDMQPFARRPATYHSLLVWDAVDHSFFRPISRGLAVEARGESVNVNSLDEVPDSSWFENRMSRRVLEPVEAAIGACANHPPPPEGDWTILSAKPDGFFPGFMMRGPDGNRYMVKAEGLAQPEQPGGGDVIGSRIYWSAGYHAPCDRVLWLPHDAFHIAPDAHTEDAEGHTRAVNSSDIELALNNTRRRADGRYRLIASLFVEGRPIGPFTYEGVRDDDPNDAVPHEDRRELRGGRVIAAWLGHFDSREQNTLTSWIASGSRGGYVRHYMLDFGDCVGGIWDVDGISRRLGHSFYFDLEHIATDWLAIGVIQRPWDREPVDARTWPFGYFDVEHFVPDQWRGGYPNPAFDRMTERDGAWMARIIARFTDAHLRAIVAQGEFTRPEWSEFAVRTLAGRRDRILARYLTRVSPLADPRVLHGPDGTDRLCLGDRALETHVYRRARYVVRMASTSSSLHVEAAADGTVCVSLPRVATTDWRDGDDANARYRTVEIVTEPEGRTPIAPIEVHAYDLGPARGWVVAGIER